MYGNGKPGNNTAIKADTKNRLGSWQRVCFDESLVESRMKGIELCERSGARVRVDMEHEKNDGQDYIASMLRGLVYSMDWGQLPV